MSHLGREITESIHDTESASMRRQKGNAMRGIGRAHRLPMSAVGLVCSDSPAKTREEQHASDLLRRSQTHWSLARKKKLARALSLLLPFSLEAHQIAHLKPIPRTWTRASTVYRGPDFEGNVRQLGKEGLSFLSLFLFAFERNDVDC